MVNNDTTIFIKTSYTIYLFVVHLQKNEKIILAATSLLIIYTLTLFLLNPVATLLQASRTVSNVGAIKTIGVGIYSDQACTNRVSSIDWGAMEPGSNKTLTCYTRNEGNSAAILSLTTSNWTPTTASAYITLTWNSDGKAINPGSVVETKFTLSVSSAIKAITSFSFDALIIGTS